MIKSFIQPAPEIQKNSNKFKNILVAKAVFPYVSICFYIFKARKQLQDI